MAYLLVADSIGGVDRRRPIHALKPGTLWTCINAHITNGGDIEKRKAFVDQGVFSSNTFGLAAQGQGLYTFGSDDLSMVIVPSNVTYQKLAPQYAGAMTGVLDYDLFFGKIYVIASFQDGSVRHFYDGLQVVAWDNGILRSPMGTLSTMAAILAAQINVSGRYVAGVVGQVITVTAATTGQAFTGQAIAINGGSVDDQALNNVNTVANVPVVVGQKATFTFPVSGGIAAGSLTSLLVNGVEVLSAPVAWATSDSVFATGIAAVVVGYTATTTAADVTLTAAATGVAENGYDVKGTTTGTARIGDQGAAGTTTLGSMNGGVTAVAGVKQVNTFTFGGTFDPGDRFGISLTTGSPAVTDYIGDFAQPFGNATTVKTHKRKVYAGAGGYLEFSGVNSATAWNVDSDPGAGFLIASNNAGGSEEIASLETYQGRLAVFARQAIQLWTMQNDDALNNLEQTIENTGTRSPRSTLEYGGNDVFYLDDSGINSLKARDASNNAYVSGVAAPINKLVRQWMASISEQEVERAVSAVEPEEARFWMAIGDRIYVYSFFPTVGVAAWSWYEPGFTVSDFARTTNQMWCRAENALYLYGGSSGETYDASVATIQFPFLTAGRPGNFKDFTGFDMAAEGTWTVALKIDPNNLDAPGVIMGSNDGVTFPKLGWGAVGHSTHVAPLFTHALAEYASISQIALYYEGAEEKN